MCMTGIEIIQGRVTGEHLRSILMYVSNDWFDLFFFFRITDDPFLQCANCILPLSSFSLPQYPLDEKIDIYSLGNNFVSLNDNVQACTSSACCTLMSFFSALFTLLFFIEQYALLTGLYPFYQECRSKYVQKRVKNKEKPHINPRWKTHSFAEGILVDLIEQCWEYKPEDRIEIGQLVLRLREAVAENKRRQSERATRAVHAG
jgi:serine/threonine protein kinase